METDIEDVDEEMTQQTTHDDEWKLQHLDQLDNEEQLNLILREINHIMWHGVKPTDDWYNERFYYINTYASINWSDLSSRFDNKSEVNKYGESMLLVTSLSFNISNPPAAYFSNIEIDLFSSSLFLK